MELKKGDLFIATWTPETINGQENMHNETWDMGR